jgi:AcrR family transcriptional regulator
MGRWEPDARGRLVRAALDLFTERGFEQTTVVDIAERAGVTERTFFRHFTDKREVLFDGSGTLQDLVVAGISSAPPTLAPIDVVVGALEGASVLFDERRDFARRRAATIAAHPGLQERELLKLATLGAAAADALRRRGLGDTGAGLVADTGMTIFRAAFETWVAAPTGTLTDHLRETLDELRALTAG